MYLFSYSKLSTCLLSNLPIYLPGNLFAATNFLTLQPTYQSANLSANLLISLPGDLSSCQPVNLPSGLPFCLFTSNSTSQPTCLPTVNLPMYLPAYMPTFKPICLASNLHACLLLGACFGTFHPTWAGDGAELGKHFNFQIFNPIIPLLWTMRVLSIPFSVKSRCSSSFLWKPHTLT